MSRYRKQREAGIENTANRKARELGVTSRKMNGMGFNSWPDRMYMIPGGKPLFIEFKRPGEEPTPLQEDNHKMLRELGYDIETHTDAEEAFASIKRRLGVEAITSARARNKVAAPARKRRAVP
jgi:hypothetical protein